MKASTIIKTLVLSTLLVCCFNACEKGDTGPLGPQGEQGVDGEKGDRGETGGRGTQGEKGDKGAKGDRGETGARGATGPKGDTGNANVLSTTYVFNRSAMSQYSGLANLQIPAIHVLEPAGFDGAFMAYLTVLDGPFFAGFSEKGTLNLPYTWDDTSTPGLATATTYRTSFGTYYFAVIYHGSTSDSFPFLNSGRLSLRLVWIPKGVVALHPTLDLKNYGGVAKALNL